MTTSTFNVSAFTYDGITVPPDVMVEIINEFNAYYRDYMSSTDFDLCECLYDFYFGTECLYDHFDSIFDDDDDRLVFLDAFYDYVKGYMA